VRKKSRTSATIACGSSHAAKCPSLVVLGQVNGQVGGELGISDLTVKAHRGRMMRKMKAKSLAELVHLAARLGNARAGERGRNGD
jgi:FixJ family two-component response regulator